MNRIEDKTGTNQTGELFEALPVMALREQALSLLARAPLVLTSPPGSGKSTLLPVWARQLARRVIVVEPRRVACRSLARFVASQLGVSLGEDVGYAIRHDDRVSAKTSLCYVTPGVALRMLQQSAIGGDDLLVIDEFHERTLEMDLLLALLLAMGRRKLALLSATIDAERLARHVGGTALFAEGRQYPVDTRYQTDRELPSGRQLADRLVAALGQLAPLEGDTLVFLPGRGEIADCAARLKARRDLDVLPLHGGLSASEQDRAFAPPERSHATQAPAERPRVILSTNVAETSITLVGVRAVIDSGLVRRTVYREGRGALALTAIATDSAKQRAGRAGRVAPGRCLRLWGKNALLDPSTPPEILREDLSQLVLSALRMGHDPRGLPWLDRPRDFAYNDAARVLVDLGIAQRIRADGASESRDETGRSLALTPTGKQVGALPVDPVLGRLLLAAKEHEVLPQMILLVASLSTTRSIFAPGQPNPPDDDSELIDPLTVARCDATARIIAMQDSARYRQRLRRESLAEAQQNAQQLARLLGCSALPHKDTPVDRPRLLRAVLEALEDAAFARRPKRDDAWGNGRVELRLSRDSLIEPSVKTIVVVDQFLQLEQSTGAARRGRSLRRFATCAMPASERELRELGAGKETVIATTLNDQGALVAKLDWSIGTTKLSQSEGVPRGRLAREALYAATSHGRLFGDAIADAKQEIAAYNLAIALEPAARAGERKQPLDFGDWLRARIDALGFESGEDLPLLSASDFTPRLLEETERAELDARFPPSLTIAGLRYRIDYAARRREITLFGSGRPPRRDLLPSFSGWSLYYHDGKKRVRLG
jgi:ATP-dependent helicase HrpB